MKCDSTVQQKELYRTLNVSYEETRNLEMIYNSNILIRILLLALNVFLPSSLASGGAKLPHIVFILSDDVGWNDFSIHGSTQCLTPHIDKLAQESVILDNYYTRSVCSPTRASLLTGRHATRMTFTK